MSLARAIETGDLAELPSRRDEDWRWTDLRGLIREMPAPSVVGVAAVGDGPFDRLADETVRVVNGRTTASLATRGAGRHVLALRVIGRGDGAHFARPTLNVGKGGHLVLLESYEGDEGGYLSEIDLTLNIAPGARLDRVVLTCQGVEAVSVAKAQVNLAAGATFTQTVVASGARRQRLETRVSHAGGGAMARLDGVYLLAGRVHADITTVVTHDGEGGTTDQLTKGVVRDQARGVFQGRIVVSRGADRTDARMGHHALVLSDRAEVDAKPELEIYADDVVCAHGNTVGALDADALFYAEQRGIPEGDARAMLTEAFVGEVVDRIEHEGASEVVRAWVAERLRVAP
ncbi:MAG: Fe-S cluster assembly protein SufD [Caulobacterales bacterium]